MDDANELAVANLVKTNLRPEFIVTVGDNHYNGATALDRDIGKYFHDFIGNYRGTYGAGASSNRFFPAIGNHDYSAPGGYSNHLSYFTLPGNERYYDVRRGPVHLFVINSEVNEPDGTGANSVQARWLSNRLATATAPWKLVFGHDPPYSSSAHAASRMRWPFRAWGATAVFSGSAHHYERLSRNGLPCFVNGAGGAALLGFDSPTEGSLVRYNSRHGCMLVTATESRVTFEFYSVAGGGTRIDSLELSGRPELGIRRNTNTVRIAWSTNVPPEFRLEETSRPQTSNSWNVSSAAATVSGTQRIVHVPLNPSNRFFRLKKP